MNPFAAWIGRVGLTKHAVAEALGVGDPAIWKICRPGHWPTKDVARRIYRFTGGEVTPNDLLGDRAPVENTAEYRLGQKTIEQARIQRKELRNAKREKKKRKPRTETGRGEQRP